MLDRTGSHTPQRAILPARSFRTSAPVGTHKRPDPTNPDSCHEDNSMSALSGRWLRGKDVQVISGHRDGDKNSFGNR